MLGAMGEWQTRQRWLKKNKINHCIARIFWGSTNECNLSLCLCWLQDGAQVSWAADHLRPDVAALFKLG